MEHTKFPKIKQLRDLQMSITQKLHGTNAHIYIGSDCDPGVGGEPQPFIKAGSRNRWLYPEDDNYGFAKWVADNEVMLIDTLGPGRHDGEWVGSGINSGEGLLNGEKVFALFDWWRYQDKILPSGLKIVPLLYNGKVDMDMVDTVLRKLRMEGSMFTPGFMRPEGIVVMVGGQRYKKTFAKEDVAWSGGDPNKPAKIPKDYIDYSYLCQPLRLEKLLSRDEAYLRNFPKSLSSIARDYVKDLREESQISGEIEKVEAVQKAASRQIFSFIKSFIEGMNV